MLSIRWVLGYSQSFICSEWKKHDNGRFYSAFLTPSANLPSLTNHYVRDITWHFPEISYRLAGNGPNLQSVFAFDCGGGNKSTTVVRKQNWPRRHILILQSSSLYSCKSRWTSDKTEVPFFFLQIHNICQRPKRILPTISKIARYDKK